MRISLPDKGYKWLFVCITAADYLFCTLRGSYSQLLRIALHGQPYKLNKCWLRQSKFNPWLPFRCQPYTQLVMKTRMYCIPVLKYGCYFRIYSIYGRLWMNILCKSVPSFYFSLTDTQRPPYFSHTRWSLEAPDFLFLVCTNRIEIKAKQTFKPSRILNGPSFFTLRICSTALCKNQKLSEAVKIPR